MTAYALLKLLERARPILDSAACEQGLTGEQEAHRLLVAEEVRKASSALESSLIAGRLIEWSGRREVAR